MLRSLGWFETTGNWSSTYREREVGYRAEAPVEAAGTVVLLANKALLLTNADDLGSDRGAVAFYLSVRNNTKRPLSARGTHG